MINKFNKLFFIIILVIVSFFVTEISQANVGIGTSTPVAKLDIYGTAGSADIFAISSSTNTRLFTFGASGKFGIGTAAPAGLLHVSSDTTATGLTYFTQNSNDTDGFDLNFRKARGTGASPAAIVTGDEVGNINFTAWGGTAFWNVAAAIKTKVTGTIGGTRTPGQLSFWTMTDTAPGVLTEQMTIDNAGKVGIGTTAPVANLEVSKAQLADTSITIRNNNVVAAGATNSLIFGGYRDIYPTTHEVAKIVAIQAPGSVGNANHKADLAFYTNDHGETIYERMRILYNGNIGIGTTTPTAVLHIKAGTATAGTAPLKFNSGTLLTGAEAGAVEFLTDKYYGTITTGAARKEFTLNDGALTSGRVPITTTNGRLTDDADLTFSTDTLTATKLTTSYLNVGGAGTALEKYTGTTVDSGAGTAGLVIQTTHFKGISTTNNTQTTLFSFTPTAETTYLIEARIVGRDGPNNKSNSYIIRAAYNAATLIGSVQQDFVVEQAAGCDATFTVSAGVIRVSVTGETGKTYFWSGSVTLTEQTVVGEVL
jgi:hypothetical protein